MILIDIYVPALDQIYDFRVEECCTAAMILKEVCEMIQQKEQIPTASAESGAVLFDSHTRRMLPPDQTLEECFVKDASRLILV